MQQTNVSIRQLAAKYESLVRHAAFRSFGIRGRCEALVFIVLDHRLHSCKGMPVAALQSLESSDKLRILPPLRMENHKDRTKSLDKMSVLAGVPLASFWVGR